MAFKPLTVNTSAEADGHIYAEDDASIYESLFGTDGVFNIGKCFEATVISNNKVRVADGVLCVGGHVGRIQYADYQDMVIENGATGYNRNDIIYAKFITNGNTDSYTLEVQKGTAVQSTAADPELVQDNLYEGAKERDYPLYRVKLVGLNITAVEKMFTVIPTIPEMQQNMQDALKKANEEISELNEGCEKLDNSKPNVSKQYLHDEWITVYLEKGQNALIFLHTVGEGNAITHWYAYLISAAESADNKGNVYKIAGTIDMYYNWNNGLSLGLRVDSTMWARVSILYL